jgi:hypothetical protein
MEGMIGACKSVTSSIIMFFEGVLILIGTLRLTFEYLRIRKKRRGKMWHSHILMAAIAVLGVVAWYINRRLAFKL